MSIVDVKMLISAVKLLLKELTPELSELLKSYSRMGKKHELNYDDYVKLVDALEKAATKSRDPTQQASLTELVKLWRERASVVAHDQLFKLRGAANTHLNRGQVEDAIPCYEEAVALGERIENLSAATYIANSLARHYLDRAQAKADYVQAVEWFEKVVHMNPEDYDALLGLSYALGKSGRLKEAVQASDRATKVHEDGVEGWHNKGFYLMHLDRNQGALDAFEKGIMIDRTYSRIWYAKAELLTKMQEFRKSISCYDEYLKLEPNDAEAWNVKGNVYYDHLKDYDEAEKCYRKALEINPNHIYALYNLGRVYMQRGNRVLAIKNFDKALKVDSSDANAWFSLGYSLYELGQYKKAYEAYDRATELEKDNELTWYNKALCLERLGRNEEAARCYRRSIKLKPEDSKALRSLARLLERLERYEEATECLDSLTEREPKNADLWNWKGNIYHNYLKQYQIAVECYEKALQSDPQFKYAWYNMGNSYSKLEENDKAIQAYKKAIGTDPDYRDAWYWKARLEEKLKRFDEALESYRECVKLNPKDSDAWFGIGYVQNERGSHTDAIKAYTKVLRLDKSHTAAWSNKGHSYWRLGKPKDAIKYFDKALEINSNYEYALLQKAWTLRELGSKWSKREALNTIKRLLDLRPENSDAWAVKAWILMDQDPPRVTDAQKALEQALKYNPKNATAWVTKGALLFDHLHKVEEAYECFRRANELEPNRTDVVTNMPEVLMVLERYDEARSKAYETFKMELDPHKICVMHFIIFATLLFEHREKEARAELQKLLKFYRTNFQRKKVDWSFQGTRRFLKASTSKHKPLMLKVIDLFERKLNLTEFREEAKRHFEFAN